MVPKKKGRKPKSYYENIKALELSNNSIEILNDVSSSIFIICNQESLPEDENLLDISKVVVHKKRGRKPKGGVIIEQNKITIPLDQKPNIILHLNCKLSEIITGELNYDPIVYNIKEFDNININYDYIQKKNGDENFNNSINLSNSEENILDNNASLTNNDECLTNTNTNTNANPNISDKNIYNKALSKKLEDLSKQLKSNNITKKSACFWCTYNFDNETILIPKYEIKNIYYCYGNFCSPECACSYLMTENIESSQKFERYYLLNNIYGKIYNYEKNIKLAPSPFYTLEKFYGNLTIQEYRKLLKHERLLLVVDKPLSKLTPELYDENEDYILNNKSINNKQNTTKTYKINVK